MISGLTTFAETNINDDAEIEQFLENFFKTKNDVLTDKNVQGIKKIAAYYDSPSENVYYEYEANRLDYFITSHEINGTNNDYANVDVLIIKLSIDNDLVIADISVSEYFDTYVITNPHRITLIKNDNNFAIVKDEYSDEFKNLFGMDTDFKLEKNKVIEFDRKKDSKVYTAAPKENDIAPRSEPGTYYDNFSSSERATAVNYATTYTDNTGSMSTSNYNNSLFKSYGSDDCQNFVSQAIWYGMGGRSSANKDLPMYYDWWANKTGETSSWNWTGTSYFKNEIISNYNNNTYGLQGYEVSRSNLVEGDYIYVPGHVMYVTDIVDTDGDGQIDYDEIYFSAHTHNRLNNKLSSHYSESAVTYMRIYRLKWNTGN